MSKQNKQQQVWFTTKEALEYLRLKDRHQLLRYEKKGYLKVYRLPGKRPHKRYYRDDLDKLLGYPE